MDSFVGCQNMKTADRLLALAMVVCITGCQEQTKNVPKAESEFEKQLRIPGTNAGTDEKLTEEVAGWTYHLAAGQKRIAAYQFNLDGTVVATVGDEGKIDYPAMFWKINQHNQVVVSDEPDFEIAAEVWAVISIGERVVTVSNAIRNREETYIRKRHWPPSLRSIESVQAH